MWVWLFLRSPRLRVMEMMDGVSHIVEHGEIDLFFVVVPVKMWAEVPICVGIV